MTTTLPIVVPEAAAESVVELAGIGEAARYLAASVVALAIDASLLAIGVHYLGLQPWSAGALGYLSGLVAIYAISVKWVFRRRAVEDRKSEFALFAAIGLGGLLLNSVTLHLLTGVGTNLVVAKGVSATIGFMANYVGRKVVLFSKAGE